MSDNYFPTLPGLQWNVSKAPEYSTGIQRSINLHELRASFSCMPVWHFKLSYDVLRQGNLPVAGVPVPYDELNTLAGFFLAHYGDWDSWRFLTSEANVANHAFAIGDGANVTFQLTRPVGIANEPIGNAVITSLTVNNSAATYTIAANGAVTFSSAPAGNAVARWSGSFYYRCRFKDNTQQFTEFMRQLWEAKTVEFIGSLGDQI